MNLRSHVGYTRRCVMGQTVQGRKRSGDLAPQARVNGIDEVVGPGAEDLVALVYVHRVLIKAHADHRRRWQVLERLPGAAALPRLKHNGAGPQALQLLRGVVCSGGTEHPPGPA